MISHAAALEDEDLAPTGANSCFTLYNKGILLSAEKKALIPWDQHSMISPDKWSLCIVLQGAKVISTLTRFRNCFCFRDRTIFSHVATF